MPHPATIAMLNDPAEAAVSTHAVVLGLLLITVVLLPLSQAVWMLAT